MCGVTHTYDWQVERHHVLQSVFNVNVLLYITIVAIGNFKSIEIRHVKI